MLWPTAFSLLIAATLPSPARADEAPHAKVEDSGPTVSIRRAEAIDVVAVDYVGPYWTVGPVIRRVKAYMQQHGQSGPLFVRFASNPIGTTVGPLRSEIGFVPEGAHAPTPPFRLIHRKAEWVASTVIAGRVASPRSDYPRILDAARRRGHEIAGPVTELYYDAPSEGSDRLQQTELRMTLKPRPLPGKVVVRGRSASLTAPETSRSDGRTEPAKASAVLPVAQLLAAGQFERLAEQLMPPGAPIAASLRVWFGQIVFRIRALAQGLQQLHPEQSGTIRAASDAIEQRYAERVLASDIDPLDQAVVHLRSGGDPNSIDKRAIMHDLDALLGRLAFQGLDAKTVEAEIAETLQRVQNLLSRQDPPIDTQSHP